MQRLAQHVMTSTTGPPHRRRVISHLPQPDIPLLTQTPVCTRPRPSNTPTPLTEVNDVGAGARAPRTCSGDANTFYIHLYSPHIGFVTVGFLQSFYYADALNNVTKVCLINMMSKETVGLDFGGDLIKGGLFKMFMILEYLDHATYFSLLPSGLLKHPYKL